MTASGKPVKTKFRWIALPLVAALCIAGASRSLSSVDIPPGMGAAAELFLGRLHGALMEFSETPIRTHSSGQAVFFDSTDLPTAAGNLSFAGHITLDPTGQAFDGVIERFSIRGRIKLDLKQQARIRCTPDGTLSVEGFEANGPHGHISANGSISREGKFNFVFRLEGADLHAFIPSWVPASIGTLDAELTLQGDWEGPLSHTSVPVNVTLSSGRLRTEWGIPPMESLDVKARLERRSLEIRSFEGLLGGAPFR